MQCMAYNRKKRNGKMRKLEPAVQTMAFALPNGTSTIDLSQCASLVNRRFYRQGINWVVSGFRIYKDAAQESGSTGVIISKLPNTWVMGNAWEKAFRHWQDLNKRAVEAGESLPARFTDFKVYMDSTHHTAGKAANLLPADNSGTTAGAGEWEYSKIVFPQSSTIGGSIEAEFIATGANYPGAGASGLDAVSLIEGYAASRALPNVVDPNVPNDAQDVDAGTPENWLGAIDNEGTTQIGEVISDLTTENNTAPYPFEGDGTAVDTQYPGGANQLPGLQVVDAAYFSSGTNSNKLFLKGDNFPCGLVRINSTSATGAVLLVDLVPGTHRGYLCEPMTEM